MRTRVEGTRGPFSNGTAAPSRTVLGVLGAVALGVPAVAVGLAPAPVAADVAPIAVEPISLRSSFPDDVSVQFQSKVDGRRAEVVRTRDPSRVLVATITVQPGARFPWHTHPGPVLVTVVAGELTYVDADDCEERVYPEGSAFLDPGQGNVHTAFGSSRDVTRLVATFFDVPATGPVTQTAGVVEPTDCHVSVGSPGVQ